LEKASILLIIPGKVGVSFEVPVSDHLVDALSVTVIIFLVYLVISKLSLITSEGFSKDLKQIKLVYPLLNKQAKLFGICLEQLACDFL